MKLLSIHRPPLGDVPAQELPSRRTLLETMVQIAWPSIVESLLVYLVSIIDTMMVGTLGAYAIAAVGLTAQPKFLGLCIFLSLNVAVSALVARRKGEGDRESANRVVRQALIITLLLTVVMSVLCVVLARPIIALAGAQADTIDHAVAYFRIIMGGMLFNVVSLVINAAQRGAGNTKIAMRTNIVSNLINLVFNYLLIGGNFGFPALGVKGAAIATVLGTIAACAMSLYSVMDRCGFICLRGFRSLRLDRSTLSSIAHLSTGTLSEQLFLRIGFFIFTMIVANLGTNQFAAHQIGMNVLSLSFSFGDGLSVAAVTLVGQSLGAGRKDLAKIYGSICQRFGLLFAAILSVAYIFFGRQIFGLFSAEPEILTVGTYLMYIMVFIIFLQITQVVFSGCLRGAGDVKFTALVSLVSVAFVRPFCGWLFCYPIGWGLIGAWMGLSIDQFVRCAMTYVRFRGGKWMDLKI